MSIDPNGLPIHADATAKIRPRIFLEGNFYVDLQPGTPSAPVLSLRRDAVRRHARPGPVQLDRVLSALNSNSRTNLETLLRGLRRARSTTRPTAGAGRHPGSDRARADRRRSRSTPSLNYSADAFRASAMVNQALLGTPAERSLRRRVAATQGVFRALAVEREPALELRHARSTRRWRRSPRASRSSAQTIALLPPFLQRTKTLRHGARRVVRPDQGVRPRAAAGDPAARPGDRRRACRGSRRRARWSLRRSSAGSSGT